MEKKQLEKVKTKIERLTSEYSKKLSMQDLERKVLLIDFAKEYNQIWHDAENINKPKHLNSIVYRV